MERIPEESGGRKDGGRVSDDSFMELGWNIHWESDVHENQTYLIKNSRNTSYTQEKTTEDPVYAKIKGYHQTLLKKSYSREYFQNVCFPHDQ